MITIALGIVLAVFILAFMPEIFKIIGWLLVLGFIGFVFILLAYL